MVESTSIHRKSWKILKTHWLYHWLTSPFAKNSAAAINFRQAISVKSSLWFLNYTIAHNSPRSLSSVRFKYKLGYKPCDLPWIWFLSMVEITVFRLERIFQPMRALKFITGHVVLTWLMIGSYSWKPSLWLIFEK